MNLHGIVSGIVGAVNPQMLVTVQVSTGSATSPDGSRLPAYAPVVVVPGQIQALSYGDIQHLDALQIQGQRRAIYLNGEVDGLVRVENKGGDLITLPDGTVWLVAVVLEYWPDWCKVAVTLQDDSAVAPLTASSPSPQPSLAVGEVGGGQVRYAEASGSPIVSVPANMRTLISFTIDPTQTQNYLNPPFAGVLSYDGTTITPRAVGDFYHVLVNMLVTSQVAGGEVKFDVDVGSPAGPTGSDSTGLFNDPGIPERITGNLYVQVLNYFMQNGAKLYITSSVPISLVNEAVLISAESS